MNILDDLTHDGPRERLQEVAGILAMGIIRRQADLCIARDTEGLSPETALESGALGLELSAELRLTVPRGLPAETRGRVTS